MRKILILLITLLVTATVSDAAKPRTRKSQPKKATTSSAVRQRQLENRRAIKETSKKIEMNRREIEKRLYDLNAVGVEMGDLNKEISAINSAITVLDKRITAVDDSVTELNDRLSSMRAKYGSAVKKIYSRNRNATSDLAFVFSANSVGEAYRRSRSLEQFSKWRKRKSDEIESLKSELNERRNSLDRLKNERSVQLAELNEGMAQLKHRKDENDRLVAVLKRQSGQLKKVLSDKEREAAALESELQRLIEAEQQRALEEQRRKEEEERKKREAEEQMRKEREKAAQTAELKENQKSDSGSKKEATAENNKIKPIPESSAPRKKAQKPKSVSVASNSKTGSDFASNRGRITFPVKGKYRIVKPFGRSKHPELKYVETDNPGIDIETSPGADVVAAFDGKVSDIFRLPGYNTIVMIRHGSYLTVYANLGSITVKKGDTVKTGQKIGNVFSDPDNDGRSVLHFEIRNEKAKENPSDWLAIKQ